MVRPFLILAVLAAPGAALAQGNLAAAARSQAENQLGLLEYCQAQNHSGADAVAAQKDVIARMPGGPTEGDAEDLGKKGLVLADNGQRTPLAALAENYHVSVPTMCKNMADAAIQVNTAFKQNGPAAGGIPGLPAALPVVPPVPGLAPLAPNSGVPGVSPAR